MLISHAQLLHVELTGSPLPTGPTSTTGQVYEAHVLSYWALSGTEQHAPRPRQPQQMWRAEAGMGLAIHHLCWTKKGKLFTHPPISLKCY